MKIWSSLLLTLALVTAGFTQEIQTDSVTYLQEVILLEPERKSATGITQSARINAELLGENNPVDLAGPLNRVSGVYMMSGAINTNRITIRGVGARTPFGTDKLRLYYNDIPVTNGTGFSTIEAFDLEQLSEIEIIKGPKAIAYGTKLGGSILLGSGDASIERTVLSNKFTAGSYGLIKNSLVFSSSADSLDINLQYGHMDMEGFRENNRFDRDGLLLDAGYSINAKTRLNLLVNQINYRAEIPSSLGATAFAQDPRQAAFTWRQSQGFEQNRYTLTGLNLAYKFSDRLSTSTSVFYSYLDHYEPRPFNILDEFTNGFGFRTSLQGSMDWGNRPVEYSLGAELYKDEYHWATYENLYEENDGNGSLQGDRISDNREFRRQSNIYGSLLLPLFQNFYSQVGLNVNNTAYDFRDLFNSGESNKSARRDFKLIWMPSLSLEYRLAENTIFASLSRGFSNPSLEETLTPEGVINPDIKQESGLQYELGTSLALLSRRLRINLSLYRMDIRNLLVAERVGQDQFIGRNAGKTRHQGLEAEANYRLQLGTDISLEPYVSYSFSDHTFIRFVDEDNNYSGNPLTGVPRHRLQGGTQLKKGGFSWGLQYQYVDGIPLTDANTLYSDSFQLLGSSLGISHQLFKKMEMKINLGVDNIFDKRYARSVLINAVGFGGSEPRYFYPGPDRNFYGSLALAYIL